MVKVSEKVEENEPLSQACVDMTNTKKQNTLVEYRSPKTVED